jgi:WhiB family redox-sensing transcriptional regulator
LDGMSNDAPRFQRWAAVLGGFSGDPQAASAGGTPAMNEVGMDTTWMEQASCRDVVPDTFFPESGAPVRAAVRICTDCLVQGTCLEYALENHLDHGIWGGASERQRRRIAARRRGARRSTSTPGQDLAVQHREPSHPAGSRLSGSANVHVALLDQRSRKRPSAVAASGQRASTRNQCQVMVRWMRPRPVTLRLDGRAISVQ